MSRPIPPTYKIKNWRAYNEALKRVVSRPRLRSIARQSLLAAMSREGMKVLFGMALRQSTGFVESLLRLSGLDWSVPDFSTLSRRQKSLAVAYPSQRPWMSGQDIAKLLTGFAKGILTP